MGFTAHFGNRVPHQNHTVVVVYATAYCCGYTDASGHAGNDAGRHAHISENRIERGIRKATEALFDDEMFALAGFEIVHDLGTPGALDNEGAIAAGRAVDSPIGNLRVRVVRFQDMGEVDYWSPGGPEGSREPVHIGDRAHEKRHVDFPLRVLPRPMAQRAIGMDEVVLHVHYNQRRLT